MSARALSLGARGIDCNTALTASTAQAVYDHGYSFVIRYVPRVTAHESDLTATELAAIHATGLGLMVVQHVESETSWVPSAAKGTIYGQTAGRTCAAIGLAFATTVWLDLEGVANDTPADVVIGYCNAWYDAVAAAGFLPGLYVGWHCGLNPTELYGRLRFSAYWSSYNLNRDEYPAVRGAMMRQRVAKPDDIPVGIGFPIDVNLVTGDLLGAFPVMDIE